MAKIFRSSFFRRTKQADPLEEEEESLAATGATEELRHLEDGSSGGKDGDKTPGSGGGAHCDSDTVCFVAYLTSFVGIYYVLLGSFYLPPEAGADGGAVIVVLGGVFLAVGIPVMLASCCRSGRRRRRSSASAVDC